MLPRQRRFVLLDTTSLDMPWAGHADTAIFSCQRPAFNLCYLMDLPWCDTGFILVSQYKHSQTTTVQTQTII